MDQLGTKIAEAPLWLLALVCQGEAPERPNNKEERPRSPWRRGRVAEVEVALAGIDDTCVVMTSPFPCLTGRPGRNLFPVLFPRFGEPLSPSVAPPEWRFYSTAQG